MYSPIKCVVVSVFVFVFLSSALVHLTNAAEDSWTTGTLMLTARYNLGVAVVDGKVFAIGGHKPGVGITGTNEQYDPTTGAWTMKTPMPTPRESFGIAVWHSKIYVFGGLGQSGMTVATQVYDPSTDSWATKASLLTNRVYLSANVVNETIYVIGGQTSPSSQILDKNEAYDPVADSWATKAPLGTPVFGHASATVDGKIYILGGHRGSGTTDLNQVYDAATNTWSNMARMPNSVEYAAAGGTIGTNATKMIYVFGGMSPSNLTTNNNMVYDPRNDSWTMGTAVPTGRSHLAVAVLDDKLFAIGGIVSYALGTNEQYTPIGYIPEFPSILALPLFMTVTLLITAVYRKCFQGRLKNRTSPA